MQNKTLEYLSVRDDGKPNIMSIVAPDRTSLGNLQNCAVELGGSIGWQPFVAVHHILTGGVVSLSPVEILLTHRDGEMYHGNPKLVTLTIRDPGSTTVRQVGTAFKNGRSSFRNPSNLRSRVGLKAQKVALLVEMMPGASWAKRLEEWNRKNPEERYGYESGLKKAYKRATVDR